MTDDIRSRVRVRLDEIVNRTEPHSDARVLVRAMRSAMGAFNSSPYFVVWCEALLADLEAHQPKVVPFVVDPRAAFPQGAKLEELTHVGPETPTIRRWVDDDGKPISLNPTEDFGGSDYADG